VQNALHLEDLQSGSQSSGVRDVLSEEAFRRMIVIERKRTERTNEPFLLMLLECVDRQETATFTRALDNLMSALLSATRETDVIGWHRRHQVIGLLFTGLAPDCKNTPLGTILSRVSAVLQGDLTFEQFTGITISLHLFPDEWNHDDSGSPSNPVLYPDLHEVEKEVSAGQSRVCLKMHNPGVVSMVPSDRFIAAQAATIVASRKP
jgi:hypothetical protein